MGEALIGRTAFVTGASRGIGRATAIALAREGARVALVARSAEKLRAIVAELGSQALALPCDVTQPNQVQETVAAARLAFGTIDILVNSAGIASFAPVHETTPESWRAMIDTNLTAVYLCTSIIVPGMLKCQRGDIVNVISIAGTHAFPNATAYCASKFGALGFTRALAAEVRAHGVRVTAILPGATDTPLWDASPSAPDRALMLQPEHVASAIVQVLEQPREMTTDEIVVMPPRGIL